MSFVYLLKNRAKFPYNAIFQFVLKFICFYGMRINVLIRQTAVQILAPSLTSYLTVIRFLSFRFLFVKWHGSYWSTRIQHFSFSHLDFFRMIVAHCYPSTKQSFLTDSPLHPTHSSKGQRSRQKIDLLTTNTWDAYGHQSFSLKQKCKTQDH